MSNHNSHQDIMDAIYSRFGQDLVDSDGCDRLAKPEVTNQ